MSTGKTFDLKVGYTCNNHCVHCVIDTNKARLQEQAKDIDISYGELIDIMNTEQFKDADTLVLTGGEPTIRREFMRVIKYIHKKYPDKHIALQTNGRKLGKFVPELKEFGVNIYFIIAVHSSNEELHNRITNNRNDTGNPYLETIQSIKEVLKYFGPQSMRTETVLSKLNYKDFPQTTLDLYNLGVRNIGVSYPHMDGFYYEFGADHLRKLSISYKELREIMPNLLDITKEHPQLNLLTEEFPPCIWRDKDGRLISTHIDTLSSSNGSIQFPGQDLKEDFHNTWVAMHKYPNVCKDCILCCNQCPGIWEESVDTFDSEGLEPITKEEYEVVQCI